MSGRTFGVQSSWVQVFKTLGLEVDAKKLRKASGIADSMNQQIEEHINRFVVSSTNDKGSLVFDSSGSYTFDGDVIINGDLDLSGDVTLQTEGKLATGESPNLRAEMTAGNFSPTGYGFTLAGLKFFTGNSSETDHGAVAVYDDTTGGQLQLYSPDFGGGQAYIFLSGTLASNKVFMVSDDLSFSTAPDLTNGAILNQTTYWTVQHPSGGANSTIGNFYGDMYIGGDLEATGEVLFGNMEIGDGVYSGSFSGIKHNDWASNEYMIMAADAGSTYISASAGDNVYIRAGANSTTHEIIVAPSGITFDATNIYFSGAVLQDVNEIYADVGGVTDPSYTFDSDTNTGMYRPSTDFVALTANGGWTLGGSSGPAARMNDANGDAGVLTTVLYSPISQRKAKQNIRQRDRQKGIDGIRSLKPATWNYRKDYLPMKQYAGETGEFEEWSGLVVEEVYDDAVLWGWDKDPDGNHMTPEKLEELGIGLEAVVPTNIRWNVITTDLVSAVQDLLDRIEVLESGKLKT